MSEEIKEEYKKETVFERAVAAEEKALGKAGIDVEAYNPNAPKKGFLSYDDHRPLKKVRMYAEHKAVKNPDKAFKKSFVEDDDYEDNYKKPKVIPEDKGWQNGRITYQEDRNGKPITGHLHPIHKAKKDPEAAFEKVPVGEESLYEIYTERHHHYK